MKCPNQRRPRWCAACRASTWRHLREVPNISTSRLPSLPGAAMLLAATVKRLGSSSVIASGFGLREGLLYGELTPEEQQLDPLIIAARSEGARQGRFPEHGDMLFDWMSGLFDAREPAPRKTPPNAACASPPACSPTSPGALTRIFAPNAVSMRRCTAIGWR